MVGPGPDLDLVPTWTCDLPSQPDLGLPHQHKLPWWPGPSIEPGHHLWACPACLACALLGWLVRPCLPATLPCCTPSSPATLGRDGCPLTQPLPSTSVSSYSHASMMGLHNSLWRSPIASRVHHMTLQYQTIKSNIAEALYPTQMRKYVQAPKSEQMSKANHKLLQRYWVRILRRIYPHQC